MRSVAIIPARGGSKRIPLKNLREFHGIPILARVIRTVLEAGVVDEVVVSTDHARIREVAIKAGARVPFMRSAATSDDYATLYDVVSEVVANLDDSGLKTVLCVLPTAALLEAPALRSAAKRFGEGDIDSLISVQRFRHPVQRALSITQHGLLRRSDPASHAVRTQDAPVLFHDAGQFYFVRTEGLKDRNTLMGELCAPFELSELQARDIDTPEDWIVAEALYSARERIRSDEHGEP